MDCPDIQLEIKTDRRDEAVPVLGQRATRQRRLIYDILRSSDEHLDVETLYRKARDIDSRVSLSTVYRTIALLKESHLVDELIFEDDRRCYEFKKTGGHHHVRCQSCGQIVEFETSCENRLRDKLEAQLGFDVESVRIDVSGFCSNCRAR
ncbi:MAG: Fur family transcriptional regulator [Armatimonadota bacterium]|jgi:Fur family ferric uptake transcriptional regulator